MKEILIKKREIRYKGDPMVENDVRAEGIVFVIPDADEIENVENLIFKLQFVNQDGGYGIDDFDSQVYENGELRLTWFPSLEFGMTKGMTALQIFGAIYTKRLTPDTVFKAAKAYYTKSGDIYTDVTIYPEDDTDPSHTPKVGDAVAPDTYYEEVAQNRWSTLKTVVHLFGNISGDDIEEVSGSSIDSLLAKLTNLDANALKAEGYATGKQNGTPVGSSSPYYHNNSEYFAGQAFDEADNAYKFASDAQDWATGTRSDGDPAQHTSDSAKKMAQNASDSADAAAASAVIASTESGKAGNDALKSEGFAVGEQDGVPVPSDSPYYEKNAKYYCEKASEAVTGYAKLSEAGYRLDLELDSTTYVLTPKLYNKNGALITTGQTVDLPIESVVVSGTYDSATKKIILTLQSGGTIEIPVGDLISGLATLVTGGTTDNMVSLKSDGDIADSGIAKTAVSNAITLAGTAYQKPSDGIPKGHLTTAVQTSLDKADASLPAIDTATIDTIYAKTRGWNQLVKLTDGSRTVSDVTFTNSSDGTITLSGTASATISAENEFFSQSFPSNHKVLIAGAPSNANGDIFIRIGKTNGSYIASETGSGIIVDGTDGIKLAISIANGKNCNGFVLKPLLRDLTLIFPDNTPTTVADALQRCPDLAKWDANGYSSVSSVVEGIKVSGPNIWDEETERASIDWSTNNFTPSSSGGRLASKNYISVTSGATYYGTDFYSQQPAVFGYEDMTSNGISLTINSNNTITIPLGVNYVKFGLLVSSYGDTYNHDIQISKVNGSVSTINTTYHPHFEYDIMLDEPFEGHSAGSVADYIKLNKNGKQIKGTLTVQVDLTELTWTLAGGLYEAPMTDGEPFCEITSPYYHRNSVNNITYENMDEYGVVIRTAKIYIKDLSGTPKGNLIYKLATPVITETDTDKDYELPYEAGRTVELIQSQNPKIDPTMDIDYVRATEWDFYPKQGSLNPVTSGGVHDMVMDERNKLALEVAAMGSAILHSSAEAQRRINELADSAGTERIVSYPDAVYEKDIIPKKKAKKAMVETLYGDSLPWNQLAKDGQFNGTTYWDDYTYRGTLSASSNVLAYTVTELDNASFANRFGQAVSVPQGHKVLVCFKFKPKKGGSHFVRLEGGSYPSYSVNATADVWNDFIVILEAPTSMNKVCFGFNASGLGYAVNDTVQFKDWITRDLTLIFTDNTPTTVADALARKPELAVYDDYGYSTIDTALSGVEAIGVNLWDEVWELGGIDASGNPQSATDRIRSKNHIIVAPSTTYYVKAPMNVYVHAYDANDNWLGIVGNGIYDTTFTTPSTCRYVLFRMITSYGTSYLHDIQICLNSYANKTIYHAHVEHTLQLPSAVTLRRAGKVRESHDIETGKVTHPMGSVDLGTIQNWTWNYGSDGSWSTMDLLDIIKPASSSTDVGNILCAKYIATSNDNTYDHSVVGISVGASSRVRIYDPNFNSSTDLSTVLNGVKLYFELETPSADTYETPADNFIDIENCVTIRTMQTQDVELDSVMDVGYVTI